MHKQGLLLIGLTLGTFVCVVAGFPVPAMLMFPAPIAYYWMHERRSFSLVLVVCAFAVPVMATGALTIGVFFLLTALSGVALGQGIAARLSLGNSIAIVSTMVFAFVSAYMMLHFPAAQAEVHTAFEAYRTAITTSEPSENVDNTLGIVNWLEEHWFYISFGMLFGLIVLLTTLFQSVLYRKLSADGKIPRRHAQFSIMRLPEQLVWIPIALAVLWLIDSRWPHETLRFVCWNGAIAMVVVYWINGLSIVVFGLQSFRVSGFWLALFGSAVILLNIYQLFAVVGFFDTWCNFRKHIQRMTVAAQKDV